MSYEKIAVAQMVNDFWKEHMLKATADCFYGEFDMPKIQVQEFILESIVRRSLPVI